MATVRQIFGNVKGDVTNSLQFVKNAERRMHALHGLIDPEEYQNISEMLGEAVANMRVLSDVLKKYHLEES